LDETNRSKIRPTQQVLSIPGNPIRVGPNLI